MPCAFLDPQVLVIRGADALESVRVVVDGVPLSADEARLELTGTHDGALVARLHKPVRHGALVRIDIVDEGDR